MLEHLCQRALQLGCTSIRGTYIPTAKNAMAAEACAAKQGFTRLGTNDGKPDLRSAGERHDNESLRNKRCLLGASSWRALSHKAPAASFRVAPHDLIYQRGFGPVQRGQPRPQSPHLSEEYARATPHGEPVVFGILAVLASLGRFRIALSTGFRVFRSSFATLLLSGTVPPRGVRAFGGP